MRLFQFIEFRESKISSDLQGGKIVNIWSYGAIIWSKKNASNLVLTAYTGMWFENDITLKIGPLSMPILNFQTV